MERRCVEEEIAFIRRLPISNQEELQVGRRCESERRSKGAGGRLAADSGCSGERAQSHRANSCPEPSERSRVCRSQQRHRRVHRGALKVRGC
jgi:hypothetical protein